MKDEYIDVGTKTPEGIVYKKYIGKDSPLALRNGKV